MNDCPQMKGKGVLIFGDSISVGVYTGEEDEYPKSFVKETWHEILCREMNAAEVDNDSISGTSISALSPVMSEKALVRRYIENKTPADVVIVAEGTNDFGNNVPLGKKSDKGDVSFYGALDSLCRGLKETYPDARILFVTPIGRFDDECNQIGLSLDDYREAIAQIAGKRYGFFVIDGGKLGFKAHDEDFRRRILRDGVHPNQEGHELLARAVLKAIKQWKDEENT